MSGIYLIDSDKPDRFAGTNPDNLAAAHRAWQHDVSHYGPWSKRSDAGSIPLWFSESQPGPGNIYICGEAASTMDAARALIDDQLLAPWDSIMAVSQQKGRGRKGDTWISPPGNVYGTWYWPYPAEGGQAAQWRGVSSLIAGDLLVNALVEMGVAAKIKWPNDVIVNDRKICGILVEDRGGHLLVGIGLNLAAAPADNRVGDDFALPAIGLDTLKSGTTPLGFWLHLLASGYRRYLQIIDYMTPALFTAQLERRLAWRGRRVLVRKGAQPPFAATLIGLAEDGGLRIRAEAQTETLYSGSLLPGQT